MPDQQKRKISEVVFRWTDRLPSPAGLLFAVVHRMSEVIEPPKNEVTVESPDLSTEERRDLEKFLKTQPGVQPSAFGCVFWTPRFMERQSASSLSYPETSLWSSAIA